MGIRDVLLSEKVSKNEIDSALKNDQVYVGAEFEFKIPAFLDKYEKEAEAFDLLQDYTEEYLKYDEEFEEWSSIPDNQIPPPDLPEWAVEAGYEVGEEIDSPDTIFPEFDKIRIEKMFPILIREYLNLETLPFKNLIVTADHNVKSATKWIIKPDGSLGIYGVEIVTPVLPLREFLDVCPKMFEYINNMGKKAEVGSDCGFHISVSLRNIKNLGDALDITKLSLFMDEGYIYNFFKDREFNTYAKSAHDTANRSLISLNAPKLAERLIDDKEMAKEYPSDHYMAINIEHLGSQNEYIEFRYIGSKDYHRKWDKIKSILAHYIYDLSLACDPTFKKKEYEHKLARLMNKIELFTVAVEMTKMINDKSLNRRDPKIRKEWKTMWETWSALKHYKEAVDKDTETKHGRKGFLRMCSMLGIKEKEIIWDFSKNKILL